MFVYALFYISWHMTRLWFYICEEFWNVYLLITEFDCPDMTMCIWQDIKIELLTDQMF